MLIWGLKTSRTTALKRNDIFLISYDLAALRLSEILQAKLLDLGMNPVHRMNRTSIMERTFFEKANAKQLSFQYPGDRPFYSALNGSIFLHAPASIKKWLGRLNIDYLHVASKHIDLQITPGERRKWLGISGHNIPSFEIFVSPDWRGAQGVYYADQPSYRNGNLVEGARIHFNKGRAVKVEARAGATFLNKQLSMDMGACRLGEFSLTDKRFSKIDCFMACLMKTMAVNLAIAM